MQTQFSDALLATDSGQRADKILRSCVHCGFCNATCPTYQLLGDELDGPRGRIYQIKQMLEGQPVSRQTQQHLDRCLTCLNCETTCPSGVEYGKLLEIGRSQITQRVKRPLHQRLMHAGLRWVMPYPERFARLVHLTGYLRPLLPTSLKKKLPTRLPSAKNRQLVVHARKMLILEGCVQPVLQPGINHATASVLDKLGIQLIYAGTAGCCGALSHHLSAEEEALDFARRNINAWWPYIQSGAEAIISTASGCGIQLKDYADLLRHDKEYAEKARKVSELTLDIAEVLQQEDLSIFEQSESQTIAFHPPCTLQHGQKLGGVVEKLLRSVGYQLVPVQDAHLCCGSAGTYSLLQPKISQRLLKNKLKHLQARQPTLIATANIGCLEHLQTGTDTRIVHWIELLDSTINLP